MDNSNQLVKYATTLCPPDFDDLTHEEAAFRFQRAQAFVRAMKEWLKGYQEALLEYTKRQPGKQIDFETVDGIQSYVVETERRDKLRPECIPDLVQACMEHLTLEEFCDILAANAFKPAATKAKVPNAKRFFEVIESEKPSLSKTAPPAFKKRLQAMDAKIVREGGEG